MEKGCKAEAMLIKSQKEGLYKMLLAQLEKDFRLAGVVFNLQVEIAPDDLVVLVKEKLYLLLMERFDDYLNLLYLIDVPENELKNIVVTDAVEVAKRVTVLILKREYEKVFFKKRHES